MKYFYTLVLIIFLHIYAKAQTVAVAGQCIDASVTLTVGDTLIDGKNYYAGTGSVQGFPNVAIDIHWSAADNLWLLEFDGQPYFENPCTYNQVPATGSQCAWTPVTGQTCIGDFPLSITGPDATLPVNLISFSATIVTNSVVLNWKTASEINNKKYEVQRSGDAQSWSTIGEVQGSGSTSLEKSYQLTDSKPIQGKNFYRLIQYDIDGRRNYLKVVQVDFSVAIGPFYTIGGNPGNGIYTINLSTQKPVQLRITDFSGKLILQKTAMPGSNRLDISNNPSGVYFLQVAKDQQTITEKLIKQ